MKFLVDAQLPPRFCTWLTQAGFDAKHTLDLPGGNRTSDNEILEIAQQEERVVVTKDDDFVQSFFVNGYPRQLLLVSTGNASNVELERLIRSALPRIVEALAEHQFLELGWNRLIIRA